MFDVARLVQTLQAIREGFDLIFRGTRAKRSAALNSSLLAWWCAPHPLRFRKNEAMIGGLPRNSFVFMQFEEGGGVSEVAALALGAVGLDFAERVQGFLELAGEAVRVQAEVGKQGN
jgi:hypothetical protein